MDRIPLAQALTSSSADSSISSADLAAAKSTLSALYPHVSDPSAPSVLPGPFLLIPNRLGTTPLNKSQSVEYALPFTTRANAAATSIACGSILAGQTSESDEYGDVGFWLGPGSYGRENKHAVLRALALSIAQIHDVELDPMTTLPRTFPANRHSPSVTQLSDLVNGLEDVYAFRGRLSSGTSETLYVLVGRKSEDWMGILGIGVQGE